MMASVTTISASSGKNNEDSGISQWMSRVVKELGHLREDVNADTVHDLRVAVRRCRSVAEVMEEVDPDASWVQMQKIGRKLFRSLGALRDLQVMKEWVKTLGHKND